jgi:hypothetical protein
LINYFFICVVAVVHHRPIFRYERRGDDESYRVRPFIYSRHTHLGSGDREIDVLWPLFHASHTHGSFSSLRVLFPTPLHGVD